MDTNKLLCTKVLPVLFRYPIERASKSQLLGMTVNEKLTWTLTLTAYAGVQKIILGF